MGQRDVQWAEQMCSGPRRRPVGQRDVKWAKEVRFGTLLNNSKVMGS